MSWNENSLHRWLAGRLQPSILRGGFGHDAAHLARALKRPVLCVDTVVEGVHFERTARPAQIGAKACARALSDLAASAASPRAVLAALRAPGGYSERELRAILAAVAATARAHGAELVGGDISSGKGPLSLVVSAVGERVAARVVGRAGARPGDAVLLTGPCGGSLLGRHLRIQPRLAEGQWLAERGARALMDVSDGLAIDLERLARASGVAVELEHVPVHRDARRAARLDARTPLQHALEDGEDHELLAALPARALARVLRERARRCPQLVVIGRVHAGSGLRLDASLSSGSGGTRGWVHHG